MKVRARSIALLAVAAAVAGCAADNGGGGLGDRDATAHDDAAPPDGEGPGDQRKVYQSGSRIKMRVGTTPDGAKTFLGWRDVARNEDCAFGTSADGSQRCLPTAGATVVASWFADAACTVPLAAIPWQCPTMAPPAPRYIGRYSACAASNPTATHVHQVGAVHDGPVYGKSGANCTSIGIPTGWSIYNVGVEIAASEFQPMTEQLE